MKKEYFLLFVVLLSNCSAHNKCDFTYAGSYVSYCASGNVKDSIEDGKFIFWRFDKSENFEQAGFFLDKLRNDDWFYRIDDKIVTIKWGAYRDSALHFETNVFSYTDTLKHENNYAKFLFKTSEGAIQLTIGINPPMKDSLPEQKYERIAKKDLESIGYEPSNAKKKIIGPNNGQIYIYELLVKSKNEPSQKPFYVKNAFGRIGKDFVDFSVKYDNSKNYKATILFEGVLTNFFLEGRRLYNPLHTPPDK